MTMKIEVTIPEDWVKQGVAAEYLTSAMSALGFERATPSLRDIAAAAHRRGFEVKIDLPSNPDAEVLPDEGPNYAAMKAAHDATEAAEAPKRERGKPAPGKARRTREEIAEDEAADKADAAAPLTVVKHVTLPDDATGEQVAEAFAGLKSNISTGEERIDPTNPADAAQDAADEAAEAEATKPAELTHDSVRDALQKYLKVYGPPATMEDGPKVFKMLFGDATQKVSDIPSDQASLAKAVAGVEEMTAKNPFSRTVQL